jgi:O-methyltransferase involved in polyketide biosynthesis
MASPDYKKISPTAKLVAEMRRYSDIPYAAAVADRLGCAETTLELLGEKPSPQLLQAFAPYAEIRYKSLQQGILRAKVKQVVEFASGFSFRGINMAEDAGLLYVETDLPEMHETRIQLRRELEADGTMPARENVIFLPLDIMNEDHWAALENTLRRSQPVAVVHEGLFQYFSKDEKAAAARKIAWLLRRHGGVWITPDLEPVPAANPQAPPHPQYAKLIAAITSSTSRDLSHNAFSSRQEAEDFFAGLGFRANVRPQLDGTFALSSANRLNSTEAQLAELKNREIWELTLK